VLPLSTSVWPSTWSPLVLPPLLLVLDDEEALVLLDALDDVGAPLLEEVELLEEVDVAAPAPLDVLDPEEALPVAAPAPPVLPAPPLAEDVPPAPDVGSP
jgi:hypothetical protein